MPTSAATTPTAAASTAVLDRNLAALAIRSPRIAKQIAETLPAGDVEFIESAEDHALSATYRGAALASRRRPVTEGKRLAESIDFAGVGAVVVLGFALGRHVDAIARRAKGSTLIVVFEPDVPLLRAVLERTDHAGLLASGNVALCTEPDDLGALTDAIHGSETLVAMGCKFVEHPPSAARLGESAGRFSQSVAGVVATVRSQIITTMVQSEMALRNTLMNAPHYAGGHGIADLQGAATGSPAVVVAAGPSLRRNIALLRDQEIRERCVIIAAQTVLKPLLAEGIKPHFVTALDYHEISARFYEGLTASDLEGVTLVAEPKANPAILASYPGVIRCVGDEALDQILAETNTTEHGAIKPGATVAHLSCYLARHLGCDPVILTGQDLGFTDGQYYSDGASIHRVWGCELNPFRTLEMFEWERIVRSRSILRKATDHLDRPIYTDEQMAAYLTQFEHDFLGDAADGRTTIDATEGGVRKAHTTVMTLAEAIDQHIECAPHLPETITSQPPRHDPAPASKALHDRLSTLRRETVRLATTTRRSSDVLDEIKANLSNTSKANPLIDRVQKLSAEAQAIQPAFDIVARINQTGAFNRIRTDRALRIEEDLDPKEEQRRRLERDRTNLRWFADAADSFAQMLEDTTASIKTGVVKTRIPTTDPTTNPAGASATAKQTGPRCVAFLDATATTPEILERTRQRLSCCKELDAIEIFTPEPTDALTARRRAVMAARRFAPTSWRGALAGLTCYDECFDPVALAGACEEHGADAALLVGADWPLVDPSLCDEVIRRHRENPQEQRLTFTQAPPGIAGACIARSLLHELSEAAPNAGPFASIGGLLGYVPMRPMSDRIAQPVCVTIPAKLRDTLGRFIADTPHRQAVALRFIEQQSDPIPTDALAGLLRSDWSDDERPAHSIITGGSADQMRQWLGSNPAERPDAALTVNHPALDGIESIINAARTAGNASIHVRTALTGGAEDARRLLAAAPDIISIDMLATTAETYRAVTGLDRFEAVIEGAEALLAERSTAGGIPSPWIVPRMTRRDAVYEELEPFYDYWLCRAGAAVIDPLGAPIDGERIAPLTPPAFVAEHTQRTTRRIEFDHPNTP